jgi:hypothetical protein
MPAKLHYVLDTLRLQSILSRLPGRTEDNNRAIAFRVEAGAKLKSPRDTGANAASIYTVCGKQDGLGASQAEVLQKNPEAVPHQGKLPAPKGHDAHVGPSMDYSIYLEFGTHRMAARPYLVPALREVENALAEQWENIADG